MSTSAPVSPERPPVRREAAGFMNGTLVLGARGELRLSVVDGVVRRALLDGFELRSPEVVRSLVQARRGPCREVAAGPDGTHSLWLPLADLLAGPVTRLFRRPLLN